MSPLLASSYAKPAGTSPTSPSVAIASSQSKEYPSNSPFRPPARAGDTTPDKMQRLLYDAVWGNQQAMARMRGFAIEYLADPEAVLVLDKAGQEKSGTATIGVKRQYVGCAGRIANAVNVVYASYAGRAGHAIVTVRPHLPQERSATRPA